jgi:[protein-PII] uridylyltransferase
LSDVHRCDRSPGGFDAGGFERQLAEGDNDLDLFRDTLQRGTQALFDCFDRGEPVADLVAARSGLIDALLQQAWRLNGPPDDEAALIAVGGYGRGELHPASDVDILILVGNAADAALNRHLEQLLRFFWDIGLEVGHSVRTLAECVEEARQDVTVITNLLETRLLAGSTALYQAMKTATDTEHLWSSETFFAAKWQEQQARWRKYGDTAYNLEPNIKENPGGLRDIQTIGWVAKRHFSAGSMHDLVTHGFLIEPEYQTLMQGQELLWRIRFALHQLTGRREDRLLFDYQKTLAEKFGFVDAEHNLAVEQFMQRYYRTVMGLNRLNEMLLQLFQEAILLHHHLHAPVPINKRFQSRSGFLEVTRTDVFRRYPIALLELFFILQTRPELQGVRASTIRLIREHRHLIDDKFRDDLRARSLFMEILRQPRGITHALRRMNRYGILAAYMPAFANIVGRMQYDLFHVYTVDEHTLFVVRNLRRFAVPEHADEFPLCSAIIRRIPKLELLYLAAIFHDIAKGRGGDHSLLGAQDAFHFCEAHGLSLFDSRLVAWLVQRHLLMSMTAQRKDLSDPEVVQEFAEQVGDVTRLDYLYLLTVADSRATNPDRWNSWKDALLRELYHATRRALLRGLDNPQAQDELIREKQTEAVRLLARYGVDEARCKAQWLSFSLDFFLSNSPDEIAWQTRLVLRATDLDLPLVAIRPVTARGSTEVFVYTPELDNLFALTTALLDQLGLSIMDARIMTTDEGKVLNTYLVLEQDGSTITSEHRLNEIRQTLEQGLQAPEDAQIHVSRRLPRRHRHFQAPTRLSFSLDAKKLRTVMRLSALDRPGLLADVGSVFANCRIRLHTAKIATVGAEAEDIFFITNANDQPISAQQELDCLRRQITERVDETSV